MKKLITLFITTALCFSLIGCQNDKASKQTTSIETTTSDITPGIKKYGDEVVAKYNDFINGNISKDELSDQIYNLYDKMSDICKVSRTHTADDRVPCLQFFCDLALIPITLTARQSPMFHA